MSSAVYYYYYYTEKLKINALEITYTDHLLTDNI